jgi:hypothetical protein
MQKTVRELQMQAKRLATAERAPYVVAENPLSEIGVLTLEGYRNVWAACGFRAVALAYPNKK